MHRPSRARLRTHGRAGCGLRPSRIFRDPPEGARARAGRVLVQDKTLLESVDVFKGLREDGYVLINSSERPRLSDLRI